MKFNAIEVRRLRVLSASSLLLGNVLYLTELESSWSQDFLSALRCEDFTLDWKRRRRDGQFASLKIRM
jgi:hypothetical protein